MRILALGPLTNLAEALERDRSIAANIREIVIMGGAVRVPGNLQDGGVFHTNNSTAEWNMFVDPLAASHRFPVRRSDPADRAGRDQQSSRRRRVLERIPGQGAFAAWAAR